MIVAIEGIDGAGKNTLVSALREELEAQAIGFPRYEESIHAQLARQALYGKMGDVADSAYAMATLFALDRAEVAEHLSSFSGSHAPLILLDRYVASNAAYSLARTGDPSIVQWVKDLELGQLGLPAPDLQVLVDTSPDIASERAIKRAQHDAQRARDAYERDATLQQRTWDSYRRLAADKWLSDWVVTSKAEDIISRLSL